MGEVIIGVCAAAAGAALGLLGLALILSCQRRNREKRRGQPSGGRTGAKPEMTKRVIWVCLLNGFAWVWCSYVLAYLDKVQIAESLSQVAVTEIIGVEVLKKLTWGKLPTNLLAFAVAMVVTLLAFFAACQIMGVAVTWYMVVAAVVMGVFVAYAAMFGFDKLRQTLEQLDSIKKNN